MNFRHTRRMDVISRMPVLVFEAADLVALGG
jgi:hypothetical protein